jgi:glycyl-tRNA synthetase beta chain
MGRFYALEQGEDPRVADAIRDHYLPKGAGDDVATERVGAALAVADRADTLAGCFGIGLVPSGSADPFALRRAALGLVRTALDGPMDVRVRELLSRAHALYVEQGVRLRPEADVVVQLDQFFRARLRAFYGERFPSDLVEACLGAWDCESIRDLDARVRAVARFRELPEYESLAIAFKRAFNIAKDAPDGEAKGSLLEEGAERLLADTFDALRPDVEAWLEKGAYEEALTAIARDLRQPIDRFFEEVFVMVEDDEVRNNRLRLLGTIARTLTGIAHFHQLST